jgi:hypothetical protein
MPQHQTYSGIAAIFRRTSAPCVFPIAIATAMWSCGTVCPADISGFDEQRASVSTANTGTACSKPRVVIGDFKHQHNHRHRHSALGYQTPATLRHAATPTTRWPATSPESGTNKLKNRVDPVTETRQFLMSRSPWRMLARLGSGTNSKISKRSGVAHPKSGLAQQLCQAWRDDRPRPRERSPVIHVRCLHRSESVGASIVSAQLAGSNRQL